MRPGTSCAFPLGSDLTGFGFEAGALLEGFEALPAKESESEAGDGGRGRGGAVGENQLGSPSLVRWI